MMKLQILGTGCPKCKKLEENARTAATEAGVAFEIEKVTEIEKIMSFGVMSTPALVVNGEVKSTGQLLSPSEIKELLK